MRVKDNIQRKFSDLLDSINDEMFEMGGFNSPLHAENDVKTCDLQFTEVSLQIVDALSASLVQRPPRGGVLRS